MDSQSQPQNNIDAPALCANGCGFHGSAQERNLCSKCCGEEIGAKESKESSAAASSGEGSESTTANPKFSTPPFVFPRPAPQLPFLTSFGGNFFNSDSDNNLFVPWIDDASAPNFTFGAFSTTATDDGGCGGNIVNRCSRCKKHVGLSGFQCRCGSLFCGKHRFPEDHACCFDYKAAGRRALIAENPICRGDKLQYRI